MPLAAVPSVLRKPPSTSPQKSNIPPTGVGFPHWSTPAPPSQLSPAGWLDASNGGYAFMDPLEARASEGVTEKEWP